MNPMNAVLAEIEAERARQIAHGYDAVQPKKSKKGEPDV